MTQTPTTRTATDAELAAIRQGLAGVSAGPWGSYTIGGETGSQPQATGFLVNIPTLSYDRSYGFRPADAAHIARCDPATIAAILARLEAAEEIVRLYVDPGDIRPEHDATVSAIQGRQ